MDANILQPGIWYFTNLLTILKFENILTYFFLPKNVPAVFYPIFIFHFYFIFLIRFVSLRVGLLNEISWTDMIRCTHTIEMIKFKYLLNSSYPGQHTFVSTFIFCCLDFFSIVKCIMESWKLQCLCVSPVNIFIMQI